MEDEIAIIEEIFDVVLPEVHASGHRWGRKVWLRDIEIGAKGKFLFIEDGDYKITTLSTITDIIRTPYYLQIYTRRSIYKLRILPKQIT
jgi:hypothetical protein